MKIYAARLLCSRRARSPWKGSGPVARVDARRVLTYTAMTPVAWCSERPLGPCAEFWNLASGFEFPAPRCNMMKWPLTAHRLF